ncbi:MAG: hypothetical protein CMB97_01545 [Flavobacteriaceae bacterium]|nr:hypothetical protein [Flavobacteriaceae bacterium]
MESGPLPSYVHFGNKSFPVSYPGQDPTCPRCDSPDHQARNCTKMTCFNCRKLDHSSTQCPEPQRCRICSDTKHTTKDCHHWQISAVPEEEEGEEDGTRMEEDAGSKILAIDLEEKGETEEQPHPTEDASPNRKAAHSCSVSVK